MTTIQCFGYLPDGNPVQEVEIHNGNGASLRVLTLGGIVASLKMPDRRGHFEDVVLGFDHLEAYAAKHPFFGTITGRVAGRIPGGKFVLDGSVYQLELNDGKNHLHGGSCGLDKRIWTPEIPDEKENPSVRLTYRSPDGEEGYPGTLDIAVTYTLTQSNELIIESQATSDRPTPLNLTNHSYFNLRGAGRGTILDHELTVHASEAIKPGPAMEPLGRSFPVGGTASDFRNGRKLAEAIPGLFCEHGDLYLLPKNASGGLFHAARLSHPESGRILDVHTDEAMLQVYFGKAIDSDLAGKSGLPYGPFAGVALECEGYSDGVNHPEFGDILVRPGTPQVRTTKYAFSAA